MSVLREKILTVATDLFQTRGINSTGVDTIVATAGTTTMTLYKYFRSKEDLILEVLKRATRTFKTGSMQGWQSIPVHRRSCRNSLIALKSG